MKTMVKQLLLCLFAFTLSFVLRSQPQFTVENCFSIGDSTGIGSGAAIVSINEIIAQTGSDYTWDFSNYNTGGPIYSWTSPIHSYVFQPGSSSSQLQFQSFPILENPSNAGLAYYRAFSYSDDLDTLYLRAWGEQGSTVIINNPPLPYLSFPMNYQDVGYADITNFYSTIPVSTTHREWKYDGFGSITMPYGQIDNVYRFHTLQRDSSFFDGSIYTVNELIWIKQSTGIPVLRFTENFGGGFTAFYTSDTNEPSSIQSYDFNVMEVFPNPSEGIVQIDLKNTPLKSGMRIVIENVHGQRISEQPIIQNQMTVNLEGQLNSGLCFLHIVDEDGNKIFTKKIVLK
jgi:hypothetical protein